MVSTSQGKKSRSAAVDHHHYKREQRVHAFGVVFVQYLIRHELISCFFSHAHDYKMKQQRKNLFVLMSMCARCYRFAHHMDSAGTYMLHIHAEYTSIRRINSLAWAQWRLQTSLSINDTAIRITCIYFTPFCSHAIIVYKNNRHRHRHHHHATS